jgi:hypothetical protein
MEERVYCRLQLSLTPNWPDLMKHPQARGQIVFTPIYITTAAITLRNYEGGLHDK